jgi:hypothetical protein
MARLREEFVGEVKWNLRCARDLDLHS